MFGQIHFQDFFGHIFEARFKIERPESFSNSHKQTHKKIQMEMKLEMILILSK